MKFIYSFQKVLDVKTIEKKQAESMLAEAVGAAAAAERELSEWMVAKHRMQQQLSEDTQRGRPMAGLIEGQQYVEFIDARIQAAKRSLHQAEKRASELRDALVDRTVDEKVWLKAKDKAFDAFRAKVERTAQHELDEIATMRSRYAH